MNKKELDKTIFFKKGNLRKKIYEMLKEPKTATELAKEIEKHRSSISRVLIDLEKKGFIKCINPEDDKFRHYVQKE